ncbi:Ger(x)C family spore germination protein [Paenibacillus sp. 5J-6]|uniref:Ger(X)C family spore germination protein n=1 Tax=Paenibacillus silvestris TaxID=2606219 RepID=A0A6L8UYL7_9BACL|nr:Ger(x)C family spore germination protein [Paenibacillus silvestris]MZQ83323.1 Ger(x)C family spore germination protein [Paenibacillus silvestris]
MGFYKKWRNSLLYLALSFLLASCSDGQVINQIELVQTAGFDLDNQKVLTSALIGEYKEKEKTNIKLLRATSDNSYNMIQLLNLKSYYPIKYGQMRMMLFGENYATHNIGPILKYLSQDVSISGNLNLAVSRNKASELLSATISAHDPLFLMKMITQNSDTANLPHTDLQTTLYNFFDEGRDTYLPLLSWDANKKPQVDGIALFKDGKNGKLISQHGNQDALWLKMLVENSKNGTFMFPLENAKSENEKFALVQVMESKTNFISKPANAVSQRLHVLEIHINTKLQVKGTLLDTENNQLQAKLETYISEEIKHFIQPCLSANVDPVGFGSFFRSKTRGWNASEFYEAYPSMKTNVTTKVQLVKAGIQK